MWYLRSCPASFTIEPSGARLPLRIACPPVALIGVSIGCTTCCPGVSTASAAIFAIVRPSTVRSSPWSRSLLSSSRITIATPPAAYMSAARYRPPGRMSAMSGVRSATSEKSSSVRAIPKSAAIAGRWSAALVLPPVADTDAIAFSSALRVTICEGRMSWWTSVITSSPARRAASSFAGSSAGIPLSPAGDRPRNSITVDIVLAVNCPPQAPAPGHAPFSASYSSSSVILPARYAPIASNTVTTSAGLPL